MKYLQFSMVGILLAIMLVIPAAAFVVEKDDKVFIVDRTGEHWDVTQARSLGFRPDKFQYGIGKYAFTPLDDSHVKESDPGVQRSLRVIGIEKDAESHAYSVPTLRYHEIANTHIADIPIAAGY